MSVATEPYRSTQPAGKDGFSALVHAELTKLRTVRGWLVALAIGGLLIVAIGWLSAAGSSRSCQQVAGSAAGGSSSSPCGGGPPVGPHGQPVTDGFSFTHQQLAGDGTITARITSLHEQVPNFHASDPSSGEQQGVVPWAKAGLIVKASTTQGSPYAAVMVTAAHGVRMQYDYTHDLAGPATAVSTGTPQWLRLTRSGDVLTGFASADGKSWTAVGSVRLAGLPRSVPVGLFVTSPDYTVTTEEVIGASTQGGGSQATAIFDDVSVQGAQQPATWQNTTVGDSGSAGSYGRSGGRFTITGSGDIAPLAASGGDNNTISGSLGGVFVGLIAMVVLGALFVTAEYRRGLIRTTFVASPRRGRVLAAKAVVLAGSVFVLTLAASAFTVWFVDGLRRHKGIYIAPASTLTELRVVVGTAAIVALSSVFALALGAILRRSATAVAAVISLVVLPYILAVSSIGALQWLLRLTPAAGFAVQQTLHRYSQVDGVYTAAAGYFPLSAPAGFGVLLAWTVVAFAFALFLLNKRDA